MKTTNNKMKLMGGASTALLATLISSQAVAQTVEIGSAVNVSGVDAVAGSNQAVTNDVDANVLNAKSTQSAGAVTDGSIAVQKSTTGAVAVGNTDTLSLSKTDTASLSTTTAVTALQTNTGTAAVTGANAAPENPVVIDADTTGTEVSVTVGATTRGSYAVKDSTDGATATGNTVAQSLTLSATTISASSDIGVDNDALKLDISGKAMGAVVQTNTITDVSATNLTSDMKVTGGNADSSALSLTGNTQDASATGNSSTQGVSLSATTLATGGTYATADTTGTQDLDANGKVVAASLQLNTDSTVEAYATDATATLDVGAATSAAVAMTGNTQSSGATGSTATNGLSLSGTTVGAGAVVVSQQENDATSTVLAQTQSSMLLQADSLNTGASTKLTDNTIQSRATGVNTANTMTVDATTVTLAAPDGDVATTIASNAGTMEAGYAMLNDQQVAGDVTATTKAESTSSAIKLNVTETAGVVGGSTVQNDSNTLSARAQGATTANTLTLTVSGTLSQAVDADAGEIANAAAIGNVQTVSDGADVKATVDTGTADSIATSVAGVLTSSSLSSSSNRLQATAEGATATNKLTASATTLSLAADTDEASAPGSVYDAATTATATADSAFSVANVQNSGDGTISAKLLDPATVATNVDGNVSASSVAANGNGFDAFATSNKATNSVALSGTTVTTDAGIVSAQTSNADVVSLIGYSDAASPVVGESPADAGVTIDLGGTVDDSAVSVNANVIRGSAVANTSSNTLTASANSLTGDGTAVQAAASGDTSASGDSTATGDYSLANWQSLGASATSTTKIAASYGIDQADTTGQTPADQLLSDSRLSVSNNVQFGEALGNSATNRIALSATDSGSGIDPTAALSNVQDADTADIDANSRMNVFANGEALNSSIALNNNSNTSLGVINNASNTVSVSAVKLDGANSTASFATSSDKATADYAMLNLQSAGGDLDSTATTNLFNTDYEDAAGALGTEDSKVAINGNATTAEASANRVANVMQFSAVDNGATAALGNSQTSTASVDATATTTAEFGIATTGATNVAVDGSAVNMDGNTTTALARGNSASNAMTYSVGATYSGNVGAAIDGTSSAAATAVVLNDQSNGGAVNALAQSAVYSVAFTDYTTGATTGTAASGSAFSNSNNAVNALAYGNSAVNTLNMSTFGAGLPSSAVSSLQSNAGVVTATATGVQFAMTATGSATGSVMRSTGNSVTAQAVGNSSVSTIGGGGI